MNRMHLDLQIADATEAAQEIKRLRELGAPVLVDQHDDAGYSLRVLADPEGNEFYVIVPPTGSHDWQRLAAG